MRIFGCKKRLIAPFIMFFFSIPAFSDNGHLYIGSSLAASFSNIGNHSPQISYASGGAITDAYPLNHTNESSSMISLNGGYEFTVPNWRPTIALGAGFYHSLVGFGYGGQLIETAAGDPSTTLYNYDYNISSTRLMAEAQFSFSIDRVTPFINVGVGPALNRMNSYTEAPVTPTGFTALPPFQTQTNVNFAYQAGLGVSTAFNFAGHSTSFLQERVSLGYRYVNLGVTSFGTRGADYPYHLNTGWLKTNDLYVSYTHLF